MTDGKPKHYRRKPTQIVAIEWTGDNYQDLFMFGARTKWSRVGEKKLLLWVEANKTWLPLDFGEYIAKDFLGYYPIKAEAMKQNYEEIHLKEDGE